MKKILSVLLALLLVFGLAACTSNDQPSSPSNTTAPATTVNEPASQPAAEPAPEAQTEPVAGGVADDPPVTLTYAEVNPIDSLMGQTAAEFKKHVEAMSGGSITINIQAGGVLGAENDVLDSMLGGVGMIDLCRISAFSLTQYGATRAALLSVPFTFEGRPHFWAYADSPLAGELLMQPHDIGLGIRGLFYLEEGFRHFFTRGEIAGMADLSGLKLRVSTDPTMVGMVEGIGAIPTVLSFSELYSGLSTGVVDGAEQPIVNYLSNSFHEVAPYMILNGHTLGAAQVIMIDEAWDKLTANQQAVITEAGKLASQFNRAMSEQFEANAVATLLDQGVTFVEVTNVQEWRDASAAAIAAAIAGLETDYQAILDMNP